MDYEQMQKEIAAAKPASFNTLAPAKSAVEPDVRTRNIIDGIVQMLAPYLLQIEKLEQRVAELERGQKTYLGVWKADRQYSPMSEVTFDGARWFCNKLTSSKPGTTADWTMMEKSEPAHASGAVAHARNGSTLAPANPRPP
jgi:hypothetical protein